MRNREDLYPVRQFCEDDMILEPADPDLTNAGVHARCHGTGLWTPLDSRQRSLDCRQKIPAEPGATSIEPFARLGQFGLSFCPNNERLAQRFASPRSTRSRTSAQGVPGSSPDRARAARRWISSAHAASASSSVSGSRLSISSAASSARSWLPSFRASSRSRRASLVTNRIVTRGRPANKRLELPGACTGCLAPAMVGARSASWGSSSRCSAMSMRPRTSMRGMMSTRPRSGSRTVPSSDSCRNGRGPMWSNGMVSIERSCRRIGSGLGRGSLCGRSRPWSRR